LLLLLLLGERYYSYVRLIARAVRLSSVTFVGPAQRVDIFGIILHHLIAQGLGQFLLKLMVLGNRVS